MSDQVEPDRRVERVVFQTSHHVIVGDVTLPPPEGYQSRFSDVMNRGEFPFIPLTNVEVTERASGRADQHAFILLGKKRVDFAYPLAGGGA